MNPGFSKSIKSILDSITDKIVTRFHPSKIILFGSYAKGNAKEDSDIDLLVIMETKKSSHDRIVEISRLLRPRPAPLDIIVKTPDEIQHRLSIGDFFIEDIIKNGLVLYEQ